MTGIERAVEIAGSQEALAKACGVQQPAVSKWVKQGYAPFEHHETIWGVTGVTHVMLTDDVATAKRGGRSAA